jgi:hypothetical protein
MLDTQFTTATKSHFLSMRARARKAHLHNDDSEGLYGSMWLDY